ncbi:MAG TPA: potassium transporter TrkG, partial [Thermodesulfobacteriota bacterium]|nr:potassium transporter TrkG [Thermodesulfobacteriota bacterium]
MQNPVTKLYSLLLRHLYRELAASVRYRVVFKYIGVMLIVLSAAFLVTAVVSLALGERFAAYLVLCPLCFALGMWLYRRVPERDVTTPEAAAVAALSFFAASLVGALPFYFIGGMSGIDSWFESMSGFTTTGFSLMDVTSAPRNLIFLRALLQWLGGMGFVVITVSLLIVSGRSAVTFLKDGVEEQVFPRIKTHVRAVLATYSILTALGVVMLTVAGLSPFNAVCYTFAGISTGGFAAHPGSVGDLPRGAALPVAVIMVMGATPLIIYYRSWRTGRGVRGAITALLRDRQLIALAVLTVVFGAGISAFGGVGLLNSLFTAASAQTTTGYYTVDPAALPPGALVIAVLSMFIGGSMGSTAGGVKLFRLTELLKGLNQFIISQLYPKELVLPGTPRAAANGEFKGGRGVS